MAKETATPCETVNAWDADRPTTGDSIESAKSIERVREQPTGNHIEIVNTLRVKEADSLFVGAATTSKSQKRRQSGLFEFSNTEAIKEKVRDHKLTRNSYCVHNFYYTEGFFQKIARSSRFENLTLGIIVLNAIWISFDTDGNTADTIATAKPVYVVADIMFFVYFSVELFIRFMSFRRKINCLRDAWFVFDSCLVSLYFFDPFVLGIMAKAAGGSGLNLPTAVLRLFRLARLSRLIRMLRSLPELMIMVKGMVSAGASVGYTLALLASITYLFAIAIRNVVPENSSIEQEYFPSVPESIHHLFIYGTFLDDLTGFITAIKDESTVVLIVTWLYIILSALTVMNMLIGVLCEVISAVAIEEKESMIIDKVKEKFTEIVEALDENGDGEISWDEFEKIIEMPAACQALESVNVDPEGLIEMAQDFFFDDDEVSCSVGFDQFMALVLDCRGGQQATVKDIMHVGKRFNGKFMKMKKGVETIESRLDGIDKKLDELLQS